MQYENIAAASISSTDESLLIGDYHSLSKQIISVALYETDLQAAESLCARASQVSHSVARGNAILGFGHLARRGADLNKSIVEPLVLAALSDDDLYVRGQASAATDDLVQFLGWQLGIKSAPN